MTSQRAVVLGAGGVLGYAWLLGALSAWEDVTGDDVRGVDVVIGTSAGSVAAGMLGCGMSVAALARHHQGMAPLPDDLVLEYDYESSTGGSLPPRPGLRPGAPGLMWDMVRARGRMSPIVALSGLLPAGRGTLRSVHDLVETVATAAGFAEEWPQRPRPWIVAADYRTGRRVVFGRDQFASPHVRAIRTARIADAVTASCSIPAWFPPMMINGVPYIDGGTISNSSVDVLLGTQVREVYVFAPMASIDADRAVGVIGRVERVIRRSITKGILADVARLRASGTRVHVITPVPDDLAVMGVNLMDPRRRQDVFETARTTAAATVRRQFAARRPARGDERAGGQSA
jgi:NTE family protein